MKHKLWVKEIYDIIKPCPFCHCVIGVLLIQGCYRCYGEHKSCCPLESNPSTSYGRLYFLLKEWNRRK